MDFHEQRAQAIRVLTQAGIGPSSYAPPLLRLLWRCGVKVPPPQFLGFGKLAILSGAWFAASWGAVMWLGSWSRHGVDVRLALLSACGAGLFFGLSMAGYFACQRRKHGLPTWESLAAN
jgi:hypothetical protein